MVTLIAAILFAALAFNQFYSGVNLYHGRQAQWKHRMDSLFTCILHRQSGETCRQPAAILARVDSLMRQGLGKSGSRLRIEYVFRDSLSNPMATYPPQATDSRHDGPLSAILPVDGHPGSLVEIRYNYPFLRFLGEARAETSSLALLLLLLAGCAMFLVRSYRRQHRNAEKQEEMMLQVMHEVNRPLVNIDMYTDLIRECSIAPDDRDGQEYAQAIKENIVQLKASTQNLLRQLTALQELRVKKEVFDFKDELEKLLRSHNHNSKVRFTLDYREYSDEGEEWTLRRLSGMPEWSGNLFEFYTFVVNRLPQVVGTGFSVPDGITRSDDTDLLRALREVVTNALAHADYWGRRGVRIEMRPGRLVAHNPGRFRVTLSEAESGGHSDPRNETILRMLNYIGKAERVGSGVRNVFRICGNLGLEPPRIEESYTPDSVTVTVVYSRGRDREVSDAIASLIRGDSRITVNEIVSASGLTRNRVLNEMEVMKAEGRLERKGGPRGYWSLKW